MLTDLERNRIEDKASKYADDRMPHIVRWSERETQCHEYACHRDGFIRGAEALAEIRAGKYRADGEVIIRVMPSVYIDGVAVFIEPKLWGKDVIADAVRVVIERSFDKPIELAKESPNWSDL